MADPKQPHGPEGIQLRLPNGQQPSPEQIAAMRKQIEADAKKNNMTVPQFLAKVKEAQLAQQKAQQQGQQPAAQEQQTQAPQQQQQPINPGPPNPAAIAIAKFLQNQDLKMRACILNGQRKEMFKGRWLLGYFQFSPANSLRSQTCSSSPPVSRIREGPQEERSTPPNYR